MLLKQRRQHRHHPRHRMRCEAVSKAPVETAVLLVFATQERAQQFQRWWERNGIFYWNRSTGADDETIIKMLRLGRPIVDEK